MTRQRGQTMTARCGKETAIPHVEHHIPYGRDRSSPTSLRLSYIGISRGTAATAQSPRPHDGRTEIVRGGSRTLGGCVERRLSRERRKRGLGSLNPSVFGETAPATLEQGQPLDSSETFEKFTGTRENATKQLEAIPEATNFKSKRDLQDTRPPSKLAEIAVEPPQPAFSKPMIKRAKDQDPSQVTRASGSSEDVGIKRHNLC